MVSYFACSADATSVAGRSAWRAEMGPADAAATSTATQMEVRRISIVRIAGAGAILAPLSGAPAGPFGGDEGPDGVDRPRVEHVPRLDPAPARRSDTQSHLAVE